MENKYYTPNIEDICIGYECECLWVRPNPKTWDKIKITETDTEEYLKLPIEEVIKRVKLGEIRVPYLTKEQIASEGWIFIHDRGLEENYGVKCTKDNYTLQYWFPHCRLKIVHAHLGTILETNLMETFSINEFRKICKLLNIK